MKAFAEKFYKSSKWQKVSRLYMESQNYICERCGESATICHHKIYLTPANIEDTSISLSHENLEALCQKCHNKEHGYFTGGSKQGIGVEFDANGNLVKKTDVFIVVGAPGSGKTHYVKTHKSKNDLVLDLDYICAALMLEEEIYLDHGKVLPIAIEIRETIYKCIESRRGNWGTAWIITTSRDEVLLEMLAARLRGEIIRIETSLEQCLKNIERDKRRKRNLEFQKKIATEWFNESTPPNESEKTST